MCTVLKNRRFYEFGKLYMRSDTVSRMTGYFLILERICYVAITALSEKRSQPIDSEAHLRLIRYS